MSSLHLQLEELLETLIFETDHPQDMTSLSHENVNTFDALIQRLQNLLPIERDIFFPLLEKISLKLNERISQIELQKTTNQRLYLETEAQLRAVRASLITSLEITP